MKYIKTKDGRVFAEDNVFWKAEIIYWKDKGQDVYKKYEVKEYDSIEELCDVFVVEDENEFAVFYNFKLAKQTRGIVYGAIQTNRGLIYIAKMNNKGELELL